MSLRLLGPGHETNLRAATGPISHFGMGLLECQGHRMQPSGGSDENGARRVVVGSRGTTGKGKRHWLDDMIVREREGRERGSPA